MPLNSIIAEKIPPTYGDNPDGAIFASNLFSLSPATDAPAARFLSLALERPGSDRVPSVLGVGRHPSELVPDPSAIHYSTLVSGAHYWEAALNSIALYVDGERKEVQLTNSPTAILDSGTPIILASTAIANGIYGAIGVSPGADGQCMYVLIVMHVAIVLTSRSSLADYVPCKTPLNMTIQLDDRPEIPLHPLDLTYPPANDASASTCTGIIQTFASIGQSDGEVDTDMILGVPFLRNTYTVLAFEAPNIDGSFSPPPPSVDSVGVPATSDIDPHLGLMNLTDPTVAMQEFLQVRVYNQPLGSGSQSSQQSIPSPSSSTSSHHLPIGVDILLGLMGFLAFSFALFGARWLSGRNKPHNESPRILTDAKNQDAYTLEALARPLSMQTDITTAYSHSSQGDTLRTPHSKIASASKEYGYFAVDDGSASSHELGSLDRSLSRKTSSHCIRPSSSPLRLSATSKETLVTLCAPSPTLPHTQLSSHHHTLSGEATAAVPLLLSPSPQAAFSPLHPHDSDLAPHTGYDTEGHGEEEFSMAGVGSSRSRSSRFRTADHDVN